MKKLVLLCLCLVLALFFCACGEKKSPYYDYYPPTNDTDTTPDDTADKPDDTHDKQEDNIPDIPNIDHEILDADRHLGNTPENYSSEETMLVEYGNRIYHCYNDERQIMEYCTENGKTKALGIYGTDLSVYKNVLYYISVDRAAIHSYDLSTGADSVWLYPDELQSVISEDSFQYYQIRKLIVTDNGICILCKSLASILIHLDFDKTPISVITEAPQTIFHYDSIISLGNDCIAMFGFSTDVILYTPSTASKRSLTFDGITLYNVRYFGSEQICLYDIRNEVLFGYDLSSNSRFELNDNIQISYIHPFYYKNNNLLIYSTYDDDKKTPHLWICDLKSNSFKEIAEDFEAGLYEINFTSDGSVYAIVYNDLIKNTPQFIKTDIDFKEITYLN